MNVRKVVRLLVLVALGLGTLPSLAHENRADTKPAVNGRARLPAASQSAHDVVSIDCPPGTAKTMLLAEDFEGPFPPAGWTVQETPPCAWVGNDPGARGNLTGGTGLFAIADDGVCQAAHGWVTTLWTPHFDLSSGADHAFVQFKYDFFSPQPSWADLWISPDGGGTLNLLLEWGSDHRGPATQVLDISPWLGYPDLQLLFYLESYVPESGGWWELDDVEVATCMPNTYLPFIPRNTP